MLVLIEIQVEDAFRGPPDALIAADCVSSLWDQSRMNVKCTKEKKKS